MTGGVLTTSIKYIDKKIKKAEFSVLILIYQSLASGYITIFGDLLIYLKLKYVLNSF